MWEATLSHKVSNSGVVAFLTHKGSKSSPLAACSSNRAQQSGTLQFSGLQKQCRNTGLTIAKEDFSSPFCSEGVSSLIGTGKLKAYL